MRGWVNVAVCVGLLATARGAAAQPARELDVPAPPDASASDVPFEAPSATAWQIAPARFVSGLRDPEFAEEWDDGIAWNGAMLFLSFYVTGIALTLPFAFVGCCSDPTFSLFAFVPLAQWGVAFGGVGFPPIVGGGIAGFAQLISAIIFLAGILHRRPTLRRGSQPGDVSFDGSRVQIAF